MAKQKMDYNSINFKNKDVDKLSSKFNQPDPGKGFVSQAKDTMNTIASTKYNPKTDEKKAAYYQGKKKDAEYSMKVSKEMYKDEKMNNEWRMAGAWGYEKNQKIAKAATDSTKKYTQKSLENIKNLNRKTGK